jgi:low affinity Fe/Cu permease
MERSYSPPPLKPSDKPSAEPPKSSMLEWWFSHAASWMSEACGTPMAFILAIGVILVWGITGPMFHYSDTWQLVINTGTTIVTFLMVFLIQNTQNRDARALHLKLDELIRAVHGARNELIDVEDRQISELNELKETYKELCEEDTAASEAGRGQ